MITTTKLHSSHSTLLVYMRKKERIDQCLLLSQYRKLDWRREIIGLTAEGLWVSPTSFVIRELIIRVIFPLTHLPRCFPITHCGLMNQVSDEHLTRWTRHNDPNSSKTNRHFHLGCGRVEERCHFPWSFPHSLKWGGLWSGDGEDGTHTHTREGRIQFTKKGFSHLSETYASLGRCFIIFIILLLLHRPWLHFNKLYSSFDTHLKLDSSVVPSE